jgi:hypothetical protein
VNRHSHLFAAASRTIRTYRRFRGRRSARAAVETSRDVVSLNPLVYHALLRRLARDCRSVLDVGTGLMHSLRDSPCTTRLGLDAHRPYLERRLVRDAVPINADALRIAELFVPGAVDLITMLDVIEHFDGGSACELLRQAESVAARRVVIATPRGPFPQEGYDAFGLGGEDLQRHRSSWDVEGLCALGYRVAILAGFHTRENSSFVHAFGVEAPPVDALVAWKDVETLRA